MEKLIDNWNSHDDAFKTFTNAYKTNFLYKIQKALTPEKYLLQSLHALMTEFENKGYGSYRTLYNNEGQSLLDGHNVISSCFDINDGNLKKMLNNKVISGTGDSFSEKKAKNISLLELIERFSYGIGKYVYSFDKCFSLKEPSVMLTRDSIPHSTTGFSLEATPKICITKAILEAIERDAYLCHWYTQTTPTRIILKNDPLYSTLEESAAKLGVKFYLYKLDSIIKGVPVLLPLVIAPEGKYGINFFCTGLASNFSFRECFLKSYFELNRFVRLAYQLTEKDEFPQSDPNSPMRRFYHYQDRNRIDELSLFFNKECKTITIDSKDAEKEFSFDQSRFLKEAPGKLGEIFIYPGSVPKKLSNKLFTCWADIPQLQPLDYEDEPVINHDRLNKFSTNSREDNYMLHPLP